MKLIRLIILFMITQAIQNSFLLTEEDKQNLIKSIENKSETFINKLLEIIKNEKVFLLQLLKTFKNKNVDIWMIKQEIMAENMKRIRQLKEDENDDFDFDWLIDKIY